MRVGIIISHVRPEEKLLISAFQARGVEPDITRFALAELAAGRGREEWHDKPVHLVPVAPCREFDSRRDIAPLVAAAELQLAVVRRGQVREVVRLDQHVGEFGE